MSAIDEVLAFDIWGDFAHFRKVYSTASQLTYGIPPRTTLSGTIAAILGLERDSYYNEFSVENSRFALVAKKPIRKQKINLNLLKTKDQTLGLVNVWKKPPTDIQRIQVPFEMVSSPKYRVYVWLENDTLFDDLETKLRNHQSTYTPYLGITECIANFSYVGKKPVAKETGSVAIDGVVKKEDAKIKVESGKKYIRESIPGSFTEDRVPLEFLDIIYEVDGKQISVIDSDYWTIGDHRVIPF